MHRCDGTVLQVLGVPALDLAAPVDRDAPGMIAPQLRALVRRTYFPDPARRGEAWASPLLADDLTPVELLRYEITVNDPSTWTAPWTAALNMKPQADGMFEYACHEGNHAMRNILSAARAGERDAGRSR